ncbi:MAG TPA: patatin-like phospholipase family protein [Bacteroidales bacterium]|nr:patatin-like phospholipase family protein [Bacteroidales bacterium]HPR72488.1 patatin-like phospholipase family protein [Bacteroidales bacterium]
MTTGLCQIVIYIFENKAITTNLTENIHSGMSESKYKTGLVLSGGGARGFAHLGVLQALNEAGIFPEIVSGTSAGALAGVLYCDGHPPKEILRIMKLHSRLDYMRPTLPRDGLLEISGVAKLLESNLTAKSFEDLKIPLIVAATDLNNARAVYFSKGDLITPVIASSSIPVLFKPVIINKIYYVDGGVMDNFPIKPIENKTSFLIGSFVNPVGYEETTSGLITIAVRTFMLNQAKEAEEKSKRFDLLIAPEGLTRYGILETESADALYEMGYKKTREKLQDPIVKKIIEEKLS